jgi:GntP family gluconate:H+ symporter
LDPFVSLLLVSAGVALAAGIPVAKIVPQMETGMGVVLAHVAPIVGLGAMLGKLLEVSGGAQKIADRLLRLFGEKRAPLALGLTGLLLGIPLFFDVGVVVLAPVVYAAARGCCSTRSRWLPAWPSSTACCHRTPGRWRPPGCCMPTWA